MFWENGYFFLFCFFCYFVILMSVCFMSLLIEGLFLSLCWILEIMFLVCDLLYFRFISVDMVLCWIRRLLDVVLFVDFGRLLELEWLEELVIGVKVLFGRGLLLSFVKRWFVSLGFMLVVWLNVFLFLLVMVSLSFVGVLIFKIVRVICVLIFWIDCKWLNYLCLSVDKNLNSLMVFLWIWVLMKSDVGLLFIGIVVWVCSV